MVNIKKKQIYILNLLCQMITDVSFCASFEAVLLDSTGENVLQPAYIQTMVNDVSKSAIALKNFAITSKDVRNININSAIL